MSSAAWFGRMRDTPPSRTLLTYFVPSGMTTMPSLPGCTAFSGVRHFAVRRERQHVAVADLHDDDVALGIEGNAVGLHQRRPLREDRRGAVARGLPQLRALAGAGHRRINRALTSGVTSRTTVVLLRYGTSW